MRRLVMAPIMGILEMTIYSLWRLFEIYSVSLSMISFSTIRKPHFYQKQTAVVSTHSRLPCLIHIFLPDRLNNHCITGVHIITTRGSALTVTAVLDIRF